MVNQSGSVLPAGGGALSANYLAMAEIQDSVFESNSAVPNQASPPALRSPILLPH